MRHHLCLALGILAVMTTAPPAGAQGDPNTARLRLVCAQLSGDLTDPGGIAAFRRCLNRPPVAAIRQNFRAEHGRDLPARPARVVRGNPYPAGSLVNPNSQQLLR